MTLTQTPPVDSDRLDQFLGRFVNDLGATIAAGSVVVGDRLGLYRALADGRGGRTSWRPAPAPTRYVAEWLRGQAAGGYVSYDPESEAYSLTPEQAAALTDPDGAVYLPGAFQLALGASGPCRGSSTPSAPATASAGTSTTTTYSPAANGSSGPATPPTWCPPGCRRWTGSRQAAGRHRGRRRRLRAGRVDRADGAGVPELAPSSAPTTTKARSRWPGSGPPPPAWPTASPSRSPRRPSSAATATTWSPHSTVCTTWATRSPRPGHVRDQLADDGTWLVVEPRAGDTVE